VIVCDVAIAGVAPLVTVVDGCETMGGCRNEGQYSSRWEIDSVTARFFNHTLTTLRRNKRYYALLPRHNPQKRLLSPKQSRILNTR